MANGLTPSAAPRRAVAGGLLLAMVLLSIANGLWPTVGPLWAAGCAWGAALLLFDRVTGVQRLQVYLLLLLGGAGLLSGLLVEGPPQWQKALSANQALLAMLAAVSFLRLITLPQSEIDESLPTGPRALARTLFGVHLFGAVINLSALTIIADRLSMRRPLSLLQATVLSRGFATAALWSPFFAAMGVALTNAPGATLPRLAMIGLPLALAALLISSWQLRRHPGITEYRGYPVNFSALWTPSLLALAVLLIHHWHPTIPILTLISLAALGLTTLLVLLRGKGTRLLHHVGHDLPRMSGELLLFVAAGVLTGGIATLVTAAGFSVGELHFGPWHAAGLLVAMVALSLIGVHPVISISTVGGLLAGRGVDPTLLGTTFLMTWAFGVSSSPLSGIHLALHGRYGVAPWGLVKRNAGFVLMMLLLCTLALQLYSSLAERLL